MAGNYPDYPSWRLPYHKNGTVMYVFDSSGNVTQQAAAVLDKMNNETDDASGITSWVINGGFGVVFPCLMDIDAFFLTVGGNYQGSYDLQKSTDTTNGWDGTWSNVATGIDSGWGQSVSTGYRDDIDSVAALGVRAIRFKLVSIFQGNNSASTLHLFGEPSPGENPDRLEIWHPTLDQRVTPAWFDWGNVPRGSTADITFRVKNLSPTYTANSVRVAFEALSDTSPSVPGQHTLSIGGGSFLAQQTISSIAPGSISSVITMRRITPSNATLSLWAMRVIAEPLSWS